MLWPQRRPMPAGAVAATAGPQDDEAALVQAAATGDGSAFRRLVAPELGRLHSVAYRMLQDAAEAEDVVQDALTRAWSTIPRWRAGEARYGTWLHRVVVNAALDRLRGRKVRQHAPLDEAMEVSDGAPDPMQVLSDAQRLKAMRQAIAELPERQRVALILATASGMPQGEIAITMEITVGAVESLLVRAKRNLAARLCEWMGER